MPRPDPLPVTQVALGRFHHFHLARQLERYGRLEAIWSGYPLTKLRDEAGIDPKKVHSFPWFYVPAQLISKVPVMGRSHRLAQELHWRAVEALDRRVARTLQSPAILVGLSSGGLYSGTRSQNLGGRFVCDRGSTHIRFQNAILQEEYRRFGRSFSGVDPRVIAKEEAEYASADRITVPSDFCRQSFIDKGVPAEKIRVIPYGGRLDRFGPVGKPDPQAFTLLFVGNVAIRKGLPDLLQAFARFSHPNKRLKVIGALAPDMADLLEMLPKENVDFLGVVPNSDLAKHYSTADAMVLPSIEEGLALVMAEAMACCCPVIASENTGARNLFTDGEEGLIVPIRSVESLKDAFDQLAQDRIGARKMGERARARIRALGGYDRYGKQWIELLNEFDGLAGADG